MFLFFLSINLFSQEKELVWNIIYRLSNVTSINVGDVPNHVLGSAEGTGLGFLSDGTVGVMSGAFTYDYIEGNGKFIAYYTLTFDDGSAFTVKTDGRATVDKQNEKTLFDGEITFVNGKLKFEGITGKGTVNGKRLKNLEQGTPVYLEMNSTYEIKK